MSVWPKWIARSPDGSQQVWNTEPVGGEDTTDSQGIEWTGVIPADLGHELYEALKEAAAHSEIALDYVSDALARYEREVRP